MKTGAADFIEKPFSDDVILASIAAATRGRQAGKTGAANDVIAQRITRLTPRELEVFGQLILGHPNKVIAYDLGISARTVEIHRARVMEKIVARSLPELVRMAIAGDAGIGVRNRLSWLLFWDRRLGARRRCRRAQRGPNGGHQGFFVHRLLEEGDGAGLQGTGLGLGVTASGDDDHRQVQAAPGEGVHDLEPADHRQM
jgi:DNA-binding CsgD family transcriptional regulator